MRYPVVSPKRFEEYLLNKVMSYDDAVLLREARQKGVYRQVREYLTVKYGFDMFLCEVHQWELYLIDDNLDRTLIL